ncbi:MAG: hypothetical protein ACK53L_24255, partial [Pirellulaceae bacterium]
CSGWVTACEGYTARERLAAAFAPKRPPLIVKKNIRKFWLGQRATDMAITMSEAGHCRRPVVVRQPPAPTKRPS